MAPLPPQWVEAAEQAESFRCGTQAAPLRTPKAREDIKSIKDKLVQLEKAQSKLQSSEQKLLFQL